MSENQIDLDKIQAGFEKKLSEKDNVIANLSKEFETLKNSLAKAELDKRDNEIKELKASAEKVAKDLVAANDLVAQKNELIKNLESKNTESSVALKAKSDEFDKVNKELSEIKIAQKTASRLAQYRTKSGDTESTDEDLNKKFANLSDEAFETVLSFVKKTEPVTTSTEDPEVVAAQLAKAALETNRVTETPVVPPTSTNKGGDPLRAIAAKLVADVFGTNETK